MISSSSYKKLQQVVFETVSEPPEGYKLGEFVTGFILLIIIVNVVVGIIETEDHLQKANPEFFDTFELVSVIIFTVEYVLTIWSCTIVENYKSPIKGRIKYMLRPIALIDLISILPFYLTLAFANSTVDLRFIRILRIFRLFRLFKHGGFSKAFVVLKDVIVDRNQQLYLGMSILFLCVLLCSSIIYIIETELVPEGKTKFTSIPISIWWGVVTMTTIGYGDMVPTSAVGKVFASFVGYLGVCAIALPVGIIGAGFNNYIDDPEKIELPPRRGILGMSSMRNNTNNSASRLLNVNNNDNNNNSPEKDDDSKRSSRKLLTSSPMIFKKSPSSTRTSTSSLSPKINNNTKKNPSSSSSRRRKTHSSAIPEHRTKEELHERLKRLRAALDKIEDAIYATEEALEMTEDEEEEEEDCLTTIQEKSDQEAPPDVEAPTP